MPSIYVAKCSPLGLLSIEGITSSYLWMQIVFAWIYTGVVMFWLYRGYTGMTTLRRMFFHSGEYQRSMHSRTLLVVDCPKPSRSDQGLAQLASRFRPDTVHYTQAHIGRDMGDLPELLDRHTDAVKKLEKYLAVYLKNPNKLPAKRPTCKPKGKTQKIDAIDYYNVLFRCYQADCVRNRCKFSRNKLRQPDKQSHRAKQLNTASSPTPPSPPPTSSPKQTRGSTSKA